MLTFLIYLENILTNNVNLSNINKRYIVDIRK